MFKKRFSVRHKIIILTCGMSLLASLFVGYFSYYRIREITIDTAITGLAGETRLAALKFKEEYDEMGDDALIVYHTSPIHGIVHTYERGSGTSEEHTMDIWRSHLETFFSSIMKTRPHYTQMRYIGVANNGRELVRVNRTSDRIMPPSSSELQEKYMEPYFQDGLKLKKGQLYFSEVTYNREHGKTDAELVPTVRTVVPVYKGDEMFGMIVINADYRMLLQHTLKQLNVDKDTFIVNHAGDYLEFHPKNKELSFEFQNGYTKTPPKFLNKVKDAVSNEQFFVENNILTYFVKVNVDPNNPNAFIAVGLSVPMDALLKDAYHTQYETLILAVCIVALALIVAFSVASKISSPLQKMAVSISQMEGDSIEGLHLPTHLDDEIGELARAFKRLTYNLKESEEKFKDILDNVIDGVMTTSERGVIKSFNPACEMIFGYNADEIIGKHINILTSEANKMFECACNEFCRKIYFPEIKEIKGIRKNTTEFDMELSIRRSTTSKVPLFNIVVRDITERKQMEKMKNEFISTVNHELRTPLTSIQTAIGMLRIDLAEVLDARGKHILDIAYNNCERLTQLVNDILDIEKIAAGKMDYFMEEFEITPLIKEVMEHYIGYAAKYNVYFVMESVSDGVSAKGIYCKVDKNRFTQAIANLLSNAAKFSPEGETVTIRMKEEENNILRISVFDNGNGIPESFKSKIFTKFAQADSSSTRARYGTGLGLNITKSIIEAFGGEIHFESEEGKGTEFYFLLPISKKIN